RLRASERENLAETKWCWACIGQIHVGPTPADIAAGINSGPREWRHENRSLRQRPRRHWKVGSKSGKRRAAGKRSGQRQKLLHVPKPRFQIRKHFTPIARGWM